MRFKPRVFPSPCPAANTRVKSRGRPLAWNLRASASSRASGVPFPTNPEVAKVSPERTSAIASSALVILLDAGIYLLGASHVDAAVDVDLLAGDVIPLGRQECDRLRNLLRQSEPAHRDSGLDLL